MLNLRRTIIHLVLDLFHKDIDDGEITNQPTVTSDQQNKTGKQSLEKEGKNKNVDVELIKI